MPPGGYLHLMNSFVHRNLSRRWALEEGYPAEDADLIGWLTDGVDSLKGDYPHRANWRFHYARHGAFDTARRALMRACEEPLEADALLWLAIALHAVQDGIGHGIHGPLSHPSRIDDWDGRDEATRAEIEDLTRRTLRAYLAARTFAEAAATISPVGRA